MQFANAITIGVTALAARQERFAIWNQTKEALLLAKKRGSPLGNPNGAEALRRAGRANADAAHTLKPSAYDPSEKLPPMIETLEG